MSDLRQHQLQNRLLSRLSDDDFALLAAFLTPMECLRAVCISEPGQPIPYVLFPESGIISIVVQAPEGQSAEGGLVGREGFVTPAIMMGTDRIPHRVEVQVAGHGLRLEVTDFLAAVDRSRSLRMTLLRFAQALSVQTGFTAMSNAVHPVEERLARWLLMCHDRSESDELGLTHKFLAVMLAVRRASVTTALQTLESNKFIRAERGYVTIANRAALEEFAGDAYGAPEAEYRRLLGPL